MATINQITVNSTTYDLAVSAANVSGTVANATTATKLGTANKGSATQPIYLSAGAPVACTYSLAKSVPADAKFTDTTYSNFVKSGSGAAAGLVPAPSTTAGTTKYLREDGTWQVPPDTNTTYSNMTAATSSAAGKAGLVPAPAAGAQAKFLRGDGTWQTPSTSYTLPTASSSTLGGVKVGTGLGISSGTLSVSYGTTASTACAGNDSRLSDSRTPKAHAATTTTYGAGNASNYGHVKLSDNYSASVGAATNSIGLSQKGGYDLYNDLYSRLNSKDVVEYNSNTNGKYYKFTNGTLICTKAVTATVNTTNPWGGVFESTSEIKFGNWAYQKFSAVPIISASMTGSNDAYLGSVHNVSTTSCGEAYAYRPVSTPGASVKVDIIGIGRWK